MQEFVNQVGIPIFIQIIIELWNELFLLIMIFSLSIKMKFTKKKMLNAIDVPYTKEIIVFYYAILLYNFFNILSIVTSGQKTLFCYWTMRISVFLYYISGAFQTLFFLQLIKKKIAVKNGIKKMETVCTVMQLFHVPLLILLAVNYFTEKLYYFNADNRYCRGTLFFLWNGITIISFLFIIIIYLAERNRIEPFLRQIICTATLIPIFGILLNTSINPGISFNNISVSVSAFLIFIFYEKHRTNVTVQKLYELEQARIKLAENQVALEQNKNVVLMAQLQPHFINNFLMSLRSECRSQPALYEYVTNFSRYMRAHFNALGDFEMISFEKEMENIEAYLALESRHYGDRLCIEYDIEYDNFMIPVFSVQPLVENAVRHGIATYDKGGTVYIRVNRQEKIICIEIIDKGSGKSNITRHQAERKRIGYENVKARLQAAPSGQLEIVSDEKGTAAKIMFINH